MAVIWASLECPGVGGILQLYGPLWSALERDEFGSDMGLLLSALERDEFGSDMGLLLSARGQVIKWKLWDLRGLRRNLGLHFES